MNPTHVVPHRPLLLAGVILAAAGCRDNPDTVAGPSFSSAPVTAEFDWSVPARFGMDSDGDGLRDYRRTTEDINPASWRVDFNACDIPAGKRYDWIVGTKRVASVEACTWSYDFPAEGRYEVEVQVITKGGPTVRAQQIVTVQDWLIVSFGDSYASGEGVPEVPAASDATMAALDAALEDIQAARQHAANMLANLAAAQTSLQEAFEAKGLAESILATQQQRLQNFLNACKIETFKDIADCVDFLAGLPYETYQTASAHFQEAVDNAQERVDDLTVAYQNALSAVNNAQNAFNAAQSAIANLQLVINGLLAGIQPPKWQPKYAVEVWGDEDCHRSANAAPARAALALEQGDPRTSVTFVHFACSGAQVQGHDRDLTDQIPWAAALIGTREIDAVFLSIGGNDAGFANIAAACVAQQACYDDTPDFDLAAGSAYCSLFGLIGFEQQCNDLFAEAPAQSARQLVEDGVDGLPARYAQLAGTLLPQLAGLVAPGAGEPVERVRSDRVYISEYVDMTRDDAGAFCVQDPGNLLGTIPAITPDELSWLDVGAAGAINQAVVSAASAHGWNAVGGIYQAYLTHGYCADNHWVVRIYESLLRQLDPKGVAHPNEAGHAYNGQAIYSAVLGDLYPNGVGSAPRAPAVDE